MLKKCVSTQEHHVGLLPGRKKDPYRVAVYDTQSNRGNNNSLTGRKPKKKLYPQETTQIPLRPQAVIAGSPPQQRTRGKTEHPHRIDDTAETTGRSNPQKKNEETRKENAEMKRQQQTFHAAAAAGTQKEVAAVIATTRKQQASHSPCQKTKPLRWKPSKVRQERG
ncbi:hypothetical protein JTB14_003623 [Gonioctena quinquepunctata]|nr:hypothetical protein JTB14_003623 [Gonioctena quinquepunctata]